MAHIVYYIPSWTGLISIQLFSVDYVHMQCLILINEWTNLELCTSFTIRLQWLPQGFTNFMIFNFNLTKCVIRVCINYTQCLKTTVVVKLVGVVNDIPDRMLWFTSFIVLHSTTCGYNKKVGQSHIMKEQAQTLINTTYFPLQK